MSGRTTRMVMVDDWATAMVTRDAWRREGMLATVSARGSAIYGGSPRYRVRGRYTRLLDGSKPHRVLSIGALGTTTIETGVNGLGNPIEKEIPIQTYTYPSDRWLVPDSNPPEFKRLGAEMATPEVEAYTQQIIADAIDAQRAADESAEKKEGE
ncbi:MAG: hypothetical protein V3R57_04755 [Candidatus Bathyarchaeia archaeon]